MDRQKIFTFILLASFIITTRCENRLLVDQLRFEFLDLEETLWKFVLWEAPTTTQENAEFHVIKQFYEFDQKLKQMPQDILRGLEPVKSLKTFLFLYSELKTIDNMYEKFRKFQLDQQEINNFNYNDKKSLINAIELDDMVRDILNPKTGANTTNYRVYNLTLGKENMALEILDLLTKDFQCNGFFQSPQQLVYNLYNSIALNSLKGYIMLQFAYLASRVGEKGNYTELSNKANQDFENQVNETTSVFIGAMEIAPQIIWRCDPKHYIKGKTYTEFTRLLQGHIQNEVDMNADGTCKNNCDFYPLSSSRGCYDKDSKYCQEMERCSGKLIGCRFVESHMNICLSETSSRRYNYIEYESGRTMGKKNLCGKKTVNSWWRWFVHCSYCMCLCDEQGPKSDRYINMRPVLADTKNNRVVTGLRFVKHNRIVHLQIQEGKLLPYGFIDNATVHWVPVLDYKITDPGVYSGEDYFTMTYENRSLALDEVVVNPNNYNQVVTGIRLIFDRMLRLQLLTKPFDWNNGSLSELLKYTTYVSSGGKYEIDLSNVDIPTHSPPTEINYNSDTFVKFTHTDFDADAAQTTVPYIDTQPVFNNPPVPLRGAGIHYRGKNGYGGFIAPKVVTYSFHRIMSLQFSKYEERLQDEETTPYSVFSV